MGEMCYYWMMLRRQEEACLLASIYWNLRVQEL